MAFYVINIILSTVFHKNECFLISFIISVKISCFCWPQVHYNHYSKCHSVNVPLEGALMSFISFYFRCTMVILCYSLKFHIKAIGIMVSSQYFLQGNDTKQTAVFSLCSSLCLSHRCFSV